MRQFINIVEQALNEARHFGQSFEEIARQYPTWQQFLRATDGLDVLYRGHHDDATGDNAFMTDYFGHAEEYASDSGRIDAFAYQPSDVLYFNDAQFDELREHYSGLSDEELAAVYQQALAGNRHAEEFGPDALRRVTRIIRRPVPYSKISTYAWLNDMVVPLMQKYASDVKGKNIIAFHGSDYAMYGGQTEYVVRDISSSRICTSSTRAFIARTKGDRYRGSRLKLRAH
jgi:hypothetical protein